jgi:hypothetical protein
LRAALRDARNAAVCNAAATQRKLVVSEKLVRAFTRQMFRMLQCCTRRES